MILDMYETRFGEMYNLKNSCYGTAGGFVVKKLFRGD